MANYNYAEFEKAVKAAKVETVFESGWNSTKICPFGISPSAGVVIHHTANGGAVGNAPSRYWCLNNTYYPVRAAHFLIGRDGTVHVLSGRGSYHAGAGGPKSLKDHYVPTNQGNRYLVGIEIESKGTDPKTNARESEVDGITRKQVRAAVRLTAAMCELMGVSHLNVIGHKEWTPGRKNDPLQDMDWWREKVRRRMKWNARKRRIGLGK